MSETIHIAIYFLRSTYQNNNKTVSKVLWAFAVVSGGQGLVSRVNVALGYFGVYTVS